MISVDGCGTVRLALGSIVSLYLDSHKLGLFPLAVLFEHVLWRCEFGVNIDGISYPHTRTEVVIKTQ